MYKCSILWSGFKASSSFLFQYCMWSYIGLEKLGDDFNLENRTCQELKKLKVPTLPLTLIVHGIVIDKWDLLQPYCRTLELWHVVIALTNKADNISKHFRDNQAYKIYLIRKFDWYWAQIKVVGRSRDVPNQLCSTLAIPNTADYH